MNNLEVRPASEADRLPLRRMLELYQHDLSDVWDQDLNMQGEYGYALEKYWTDPTRRAFVFLVGGRYAGFALVNNSVTFPGNEHWMAQFFVLKKYRRQEVGSRAAQCVFNLVPGRWEVGQMASNFPAHRFWRRVIGAYTGNDFIEHDLNDDRWEGLLQCFHTPRNTAGCG
jgi:predicted acetyltransferase